jgi:hypothetical protein
MENATAVSLLQLEKSNSKLLFVAANRNGKLNFVFLGRLM